MAAAHRGRGGNLSVHELNLSRRWSAREAWLREVVRRDHPGPEPGSGIRNAGIPVCGS
jgi:hypothetical protein